MANTKGTKKSAPKNRSLLQHGALMRFSRAVLFRKKMLYKKKFSDSKAERKVVVTKRKAPEMKVKKMNGTKNGAERKVPVRRSSRFFFLSAGRRTVGKKISKKMRPTKLRGSIKPGQILILLAGHQKGKRVVFLKQLSSGLLLVTGPYRVNGCPLRRIDQAYVIATKTRIDISSVKIAENINDAAFKRAKPEKRLKKETDIFAKSKEAYKVSEQRKKDQVEVDKQVLAAIKKNAEKNLLLEYLKASFCLRNKQLPHNMVF